MHINGNERVADMAKHTDEFRRGTTDYIISTGRPMTKCCRELGLNPKTADRWGARRRREISGELDPKARKCESREI